MRPNRYLGLILVAAFIGFVFASVSTRDFAMHLDRQVHDVTCSFTPGLSGPEKGESGCLVTMVSPYSSVLRSVVWGGIPIALPGMAVFAFLFAFGIELMVSGRMRHSRAAFLMALATAVPLLTSVVMATISAVELGTMCKLCVGIYISSALAFAGGLGLYLSARKGGASSAKTAPRREAAPPAKDEPAFVSGDESEPTPAPAHAPARAEHRQPEPRLGAAYVAAVIGIGVLAVAVPAAGYVISAPDHSRYIGTCGGLVKPAERDLVIPLGRPGGVPAIEILDPLCPACKQFEERLSQVGEGDELSRLAVLFPLDDACNWMVDSAIHPGACAVSEAMICAGPRAEEVLLWAFEQQEAILSAAASDPGAAKGMVAKRFPDLESCLGTPEVKAKLNRSLRWAVANRIRVLTPQLFIGDVKLCDEDVDLGLSFALSRMIAGHRSGTLRVVGGELEEPEAAPPVVETHRPEEPGPAGTEPGKEESAAPSSGEPSTDGGAADEPGEPAGDTPEPSDDTGGPPPGAENEAAEPSPEPAAPEPPAPEPAAPEPAAPAPTEEAPSAPDPSPASATEETP